MSEAFHKWIVDKGYATLTSDVQLALWDAWLAGGLDALLKGVPNTPALSDPSSVPHEKIAGFVARILDSQKL
jgi:hypothetical protein